MDSVIATAIGELHVRVEGTGPVAVLWHSLFVDDRSWDRIAGTLAHERRLVRITGPGHGSSTSRTRTYDLADCVAAALVVLDALDVDGPVDWVGNAWGGHVGILLAALHSHRIRTLAAFNAPVQALSRSERRKPAVVCLALRLVGPIEPVIRGVTSALLSPRSRAVDTAAVAYVRACLRSANRRALVTAIRGISLGRRDLSLVLWAISAPTILVTSDGDPLWTPQRAQAASALLPHGSSAVVLHTGHLTPYEDPATSIGLISRLWAAKPLGA